jgi:hypothetical protein
MVTYFGLLAFKIFIDGVLEAILVDNYKPGFARRAIVENGIAKPLNGIVLDYDSVVV